MATSQKKYHLDVDLSEEIGNPVRNKMNSRDIIDAIKIGNLTKSADDVDWLINIQLKYAKKLGG